MNGQCLLSNADITLNNYPAANSILVSDACVKVGVSH